MRPGLGLRALRVLAVVLGMVAPVLADDPFRAFGRIQVGMTRSQVVRIMGPAFA